MYQSMFGAGEGTTAFGYDMLVIDDFNKQEEKRNSAASPTNDEKGGKNARY